MAMTTRTGGGAIRGFTALAEGGGRFIDRDRLVHDFRRDDGSPAPSYHGVVLHITNNRGEYRTRVTAQLE